VILSLFGYAEKQEIPRLKENFLNYKFVTSRLFYYSWNNRWPWATPENHWGGL